MRDNLKEYNASQREAICHGDGPALVLAGPGSGKTTVLTKRLQHLITTLHVSPQKILVVTFTKAAATEMQQRFQNLMGEKLPVCFGTFHSIFYRILKEFYSNNCQSTFSQNSLTILNEKEKHRIMQQILKREQINEEFAPAFLEHFKKIKGGAQNRTTEAVNDENMRLESGLPEQLTTEQLLHIFEHYRRKCKESGKLDFDDMAYECLRLFQTRPDILKKWQRCFQYILVDEYQDIAPIQEQLLFLLALPENNLFLVGDDDQTIYGFRGAGTESMLDFPKKYPDTKLIFLEMNYRCRPEIVENAGKVIAENKKRFVKTQVAARKYADEASVICRGFLGKKEEYAEILNILTELEKKGQLDDCAILYRKNRDAGALMRLLEQHKLPYVCAEPKKKLQEHFITEDITAYLRFLSGDRSRKNFYKIMNRPERQIERESCGAERISFAELKQWYRDDETVVKQIQRLEEGCRRAAGLSLYAQIMYIRKGLGYEEWLRKAGEDKQQEEYLEILHDVQEQAKQTLDIRAWESWLTEKNVECNEKCKEERKGVRILTYHGCKGLEFDHVILPDLNEGIVPHKKALTEAELEEERRMFYVGMTRAKERLYLYYRIGTKEEPETMSRFLKVLDYSSSSTNSSNSALSRYSSNASATISYSSSSSI